MPPQPRLQLQHTHHALSIDIQGSWLQDQFPHFPIPYDSLPSVHSLPVSSSAPSMFTVAANMSRIWRDRFPQRPVIPDILDDVVVVTAHLTSESGRTAGAIWTDSIATGVWVNPIVHRLLQLRLEQPDCSNCNDVLQESFRVTALLYLARTKFHASLIARLTMTYVAKLKACLSNGDRTHWLRLEPLKVWILVIGAMHAEELSDERLWFELEILKMAQLMNMTDLRTVEATAKSMLWD